MEYKPVLRTAKPRMRMDKSLQRTIVSLFASLYFGIGIVLNYVSIRRIPVGTFIVLLLVLLTIHKPIDKDHDTLAYRYVLVIKAVYIILLLAFSFLRGLSASLQNIYVMASVSMSVFSYVAVFKLLHLKLITVDKILISVVISLSLSSFIAVLQSLDLSWAWELRGFFLSFEEYAQTTERGLNVRTLGYPVGLSLTSVALGTDLTYWLPLIIFVIPSILGKYFGKLLGFLFGLVLILMSFLGLYMSQLRSGMYGVLFALLPGLLFHYASPSGRIYDRAKPLKIYFSLVFFVLLALLISGSARFSSVFDYSVIIEDVRFGLWKELLGILVYSFPGAGLTDMTRQYLGLQIGFHNQILLIASQTSLFGIVLFVALIIWLTMKLTWLFLSVPHSSLSARIAYYSGLGVVVSGLINSFFHNVNYFTQSDALSVILAVFVYSLGKVDFPSSS